MDKNNFQSIVYSRIKAISNDSTNAKKARADLRKSVGRPIPDNPDVWNVLYTESTLDRLVQDDTRIDAKEQVLNDVLSLYSIHYRHNELANSSELDDTFPKFLQSLKQSFNEDSFNKQVNQLFASKDYQHSLRLISKFIRMSNKTKAKINYRGFSWEIFLLGTSKRKNVLYSWGRSYYALSNNKKD